MKIKVERVGSDPGYCREMFREYAPEKHHSQRKLYVCQEEAPNAWQWYSAAETTYWEPECPIADHVEMVIVK